MEVASTAVTLKTIYFSSATDCGSPELSCRHSPQRRCQHQVNERRLVKPAVTSDHAWSGNFSLMRPYHGHTACCLVSLRRALEVMNDSCCFSQNRASLILTAQWMCSPQLHEAQRHLCNSQPSYSGAKGVMSLFI